MSYSFNQRPTFGNSSNNNNNSNSIWRAKKPSSAALPLYKDKPISTSTTNTAKTAATEFYISNRSGKNFIKMLFKASIAFFCFYVIYQLGQSWSDSNSDDLTTDAHSWASRKLEVKNAFLDSWHDYEANGWGYDVYHPVSQRGENMGPKPLGWIIVDSLDTMMIMGCNAEIERAKQWVKNTLTYDFNYEVNVFETTIRMLGGFLSSYYLSEDDLYLDKAVDLANRLVNGFESRTGIPYASVNLKTGKGIKSHADGGASSTAEVATLQLEFKYLAKLTGESMYWEKVEKIMSVLNANHPKDGLVPIFVNPETGKYQGRNIRLGSRGDSYYEYLLKQYLQTKEPIYSDMYEEAVAGIKRNMVAKSKPNGYTYIGELPNGVNSGLDPKMDHLVCFIGGLLALGATEGSTINEARKNSAKWSTTQEANFMLGKEITYTCYKMYHDVDKTGLAPEIVVFNQDPKSINDFHIKPADRHNLQRPETVESLYYLYKITKDPMYREWGYEIFQNFIKHTKVTNGGGVRYTSLDDVTTGRQRDNMESFWLAETLKYLYMLFDDEDRFDLSKVVFNTEAHPFPVFDMDPLFKTGWTRSGGMINNQEEAGQEEVPEEIVKVKKVIKNQDNIAIRDTDPVIEKAKNKQTQQEEESDADSDILDPNVMKRQGGGGIDNMEAIKDPNAGGAAAAAVAGQKANIKAEKSFNELDKKKVSQQQQHQGTSQKPAKAIDEEIKALKKEVGGAAAPVKKAGGVEEDRGKIFKNKEEINERVEELINEGSD